MGVTDWFVAAAVSGSACAAMAMVVCIVGWRRGLADVATVGGALYALSVLMTTSALAATVVGRSGSTGDLAATLAAPVGLALAAPVVSRDRLASARRHWRAWTLSGAVVSSSVAGLAAVAQVTVPLGVVAVMTMFGAWWAIALVRRQLLLYRIARRPALAVAVIGLGVLGVSGLAGPWTVPGSMPAWMLLVADNVGLLASAAAMVAGYRTGRSVSDVLAPLVAHDPCAALDIGLAPEVQAFVAALGRKDPVTREHVVRTSATAMHAASRAGLPARTVREVAIGALLHDIGKLVIPSEIIGKAGALTDDEYATIRTHPEQGERLLRDTPTLAAAGRYVRGHHERHDGRGYPDGIAGDQIPLEVALVSVADAWDAMTNTRQYRQGMPADRARTILIEGAGSQWSPDAVRWVLAVADQHLPSAPRPFGADVTGSSTGAAEHDCATDHQLDTPHQPDDSPSVQGACAHQGEQKDRDAEHEHDELADAAGEDGAEAPDHGHHDDLHQHAGIRGRLDEIAQHRSS